MDTPASKTTHTLLSDLMLPQRPADCSLVSMYIYLQIKNAVVHKHGLWCYDRCISHSKLRNRLLELPPRRRRRTTVPQASFQETNTVKITDCRLGILSGVLSIGKTLSNFIGMDFIRCLTSNRHPTPACRHHRLFQGEKLLTSEADGSP